MATIAQRESVLKNSINTYRIIIKIRKDEVIKKVMNQPLDVSGLGVVYIEQSDNHSTDHANATMQVLDTFENQLSDGFNDNNILKINAHSDIINYLELTDYYTHVTIKTRKDIRRVLDAWKTKRANLETQTYIWSENYKEQLEKIEGVIPVTNSHGQPLTGIPNIVERERIKTELDNDLIYENAEANILATVIPTGLSDNVLEASQQAMEWLVSAAERKSNWVVNAIEENYMPSQSATPDQENALKTIEVERQKGVRAIQRATAKNAIQTAYDTAKAAIDNVTVTNAPIWKLDNGSTIPLTDGRHVIPYTEAGGSVTYRADNRVIDEEDSTEISNVSVDKNNAPEPLRFTYQPASGTIAASYGVTMTYGGTKHPPMGNYDVEITARNASGPALLKIRFVVPDFQPSFLKTSLSDKTLTLSRWGRVNEIIQFDEATGGNGQITYSISPILGNQGSNTHPRTREQRITSNIPKPKEMHTITATDEDGDTATQTVAVTIVR